MDITKQLELMKKDINDEDSELYSLVFTPLNIDKEEFITKLSEGIAAANQLSFYGGYDTVYAAYTFINGRQVYFKFSAPKEEMVKAVGPSAPYLEMYNGGANLIELGPDILLKYAMPYYYKEFATYSSAYAEHPAVKSWGSFVVSED